MMPSSAQGLLVEQKPVVMVVIGWPSTSGRPGEESEPVRPDMPPVWVWAGVSAPSLLDPNTAAPTAPREERKLRRPSFIVICGSLKNSS
jgi:hypothetical protein